MRKARDDVLEFCARLDMARLGETRQGQWCSGAMDQSDEVHDATWYGAGPQIVRAGGWA
jgi:hypothetical protein